MDKSVTQRGQFQKGFTLLETLIILGIIAVVLAIVLPPFFSIIQKYRAETAVEQVAMNIRFARLAAVKKRIPYRVVFNATPTNTYQVQTNPSKDLSTWVNYDYSDTSMPKGLTILAGGISDVTFNPRGSATISGGTNIRVQSTGFIYKIDVFTSGAVTKTAE